MSRVEFDESLDRITIRNLGSLKGSMVIHIQLRTEVPTTVYIHKPVQKFTYDPLKIKNYNLVNGTLELMFQTTN